MAVGTAGTGAAITDEGSATDVVTDTVVEEALLEDVVLAAADEPSPEDVAAAVADVGSVVEDVAAAVTAKPHFLPS
jgi:hypothetical protein